MSIVLQRDCCLDPMMMAIYSATAPVDDDPIHWEDECTLQFGVEDEDVQHRGITAGGVIFREYGGEDFSKYLDDDEVPAVPLAVTGSAQVLEEPNRPSTRRYQKRQSRKRPDEATTIGAFDQVESPADSGSTSGPKKSLDGLRERIVQLLPGSSKKHRSKSREGNKIQNYSFTDLRVGSSLLTEQQRLSAGSSISSPSAANATAVQHETDSGSEIRSSISLETRSDLGFRDLRSSWWNLETLSDRQGTSVIESNGRQKTRNRGTSKFQRRAESVPDLLDSSDVDGGPQRHPSQDSGSSGGRVSQRRHLGNVNGGLVNCWDEDVRRQAEQSTPPNSAQGRSIWKKLTHTINKRTRRSKGFDGGQQQQRPPANDVRPTQIHQQRPPANAMRPPPTPPPNSADTADIYDEIRL